ncbi:MAG: peroxidase, partial [Veillonella sp.]|nr:peroxidase [Veillonella sp.]
MAVDVSRTQDVYKDAGQSVNFTTLLLNRKDRDAELEVIQDMADRIQAIKRSVS